MEGRIVCASRFGDPRTGWSDGPRCGQSRSAHCDVVACVPGTEHIYPERIGTRDWLTDMVRAALPLMDEGFGLSAGTYDAAAPDGHASRQALHRHDLAVGSNEAAPVVVAIVELEAVLALAAIFRHEPGFAFRTDTVGEEPHRALTLGPAQFERHLDGLHRAGGSADAVASLEFARRLSRFRPGGGFGLDPGDVWRAARARILGRRCATAYRQCGGKDREIRNDSCQHSPNLTAGKRPGTLERPGRRSCRRTMRMTEASRVPSISAQVGQMRLR